MCKTCAAPVAGPYCVECGQKVIQQRITMRSLSADFFRQLTDLDRGFWHTVLMLFRNPGKVIRDYIGGSTVRYAPPLRYLLIWVTISFLVYVSMGQYEQQNAELRQFFDMEDKTDNMVFQDRWTDFVKTYSQLFALLFVPIYAFFTRLLFRSKGLNFAEHLVGNAYFSAQTAIFSILTAPLLFLLFRSFVATSIASFVITIAYYTVGLRSLFDQRWAPAFFKSVLTILLGFLGYSIVVGVVGIIFGIFLAVSNKM